MLSTSIRRALALSLALALAVPQTGAGQVPAPAVTFVRASDVPRQVAWGVTAEREDRVARGVILGALAGAAAGLVVGGSACSSCDDDAPVLAVMGLGAALGAVIGFFVGWRSPGE